MDTTWVSDDVSIRVGGDFHPYQHKRLSLLTVSTAVNCNAIHDPFEFPFFRLTKLTGIVGVLKFDPCKHERHAKVHSPPELAFGHCIGISINSFIRRKICMCRTLTGWLVKGYVRSCKDQ